MNENLRSILTGTAALSAAGMAEASLASRTMWLKRCNQPIHLLVRSFHEDTV
jgi:hypothetical protein